MRYFNSIVEAGKTLGVTTLVLRWLLENNKVSGEYRQGQWSIPVDQLMEMKENGSFAQLVEAANRALKPKHRRRRSSRSWRPNETHRSYVRAH